MENVDIKLMGEKLQELIKKRDKIKTDVLRIQGKKEAAEKSLEDFKKRCLEKNIDPDKLDETIATLTQKYQEAVSSLEENIKRAEEYLATFTDKV